MGIVVNFGRTVALAITALGVFAVDQAAKTIVVEFVMQPPRTIALTGFVNLILSFNTGISFGMFSQLFRENAAILGTVQAIVALIVMIYALYVHRRRVDALALAMLAGGAASNAADRLQRSAVVDFIDVHVAGLHWPSFNFADIAIVAGVVVLAASGISGARHSSKTQRTGS